MHSMGNKGYMVLDLRKNTDYIVNDIPGQGGSTPSIVSDNILEKTDSEYLYTVLCKTYNRDDAFKFCENSGIELSGCTAVRKGNYYGRNLDFIYNDTVSVLVKTPHTEYRNASIGTADCLSLLLKDKMKDIYEGNDYSPILDFIPWVVVDGMNEHGVVCNSNVVPILKDGDVEDHGDSIPDIEVKEVLHDTMVIRYILDNFDNAKDAVEYIRDYVSVKMSPKLHLMGYHVHWMVADKTSTYIMECIDRKFVFRTDVNVMSNFYTTGVDYNEDGTVYSNVDVNDGNLPGEANHITDHGSGLERHNIAVSQLEGIESAADMRSVMNSLQYSKAYTLDPHEDDFWFSEFIGGPYTVNTPSDDEDFVAIIEHYIDVFNHRSKTPGDPTYGTWWTQHSIVYDMENLTANIVVQEDYDHEFNYAITL